MKYRVSSQLVNGIVAALLLSACAQTGEDRPIAAATPAPAVVETVQPPQPVLPVLKPGTKKHAPAKPKLDHAAEDAAAAAAAAEGETAPGTVSPGSAGANAPVLPELPADAPTDPAATTTGLEAALPQPEYIPAEPEPEQTGSPDDLRGQTEIQVMNTLGSPISTRADGTSTIWSYRAGQCTLDVYFFLDVADNQRRALSYELIANQAGTQAAERCYQALITNASSAP